MDQEYEAEVSFMTTFVVIYDESVRWLRLNTYCSLISHVLIPRKLDVSLPKFTMEQSYALHTILPGMGIQDVFKDTANFKGMSQEAGLKVSQASVQFSSPCKL